MWEESFSLQSDGWAITMNAFYRKMYLYSYSNKPIIYINHKLYIICLLNKRFINNKYNQTLDIKRTFVHSLCSFNINYK